MSLLAWLFGMVQPVDSGQTVRDWIVGQTDAALEITEAVGFPTPRGQVAMLDTLIPTPEPKWIDVPDTGGQIVVFHDTGQGRNSILALVFSEATVAGGAAVGVVPIGTGLISVFTPDTYACINLFFDSFGENGDPYYDFFSLHDDPQGGERKIVPLPDGTPVPYIHSGRGDGSYPVYTLQDVAGEVIAVYTDFMGINDTGDWLRPPGVRN